MNEEINNSYADIDKLIQNQNSMLEQQQAQQNNILDQQLQMQIDQMNRNKAEIDENAAKTNAGLYTEYKKASNPYSANAEQLWSQGLGKSGYAESTQTNLYNTYQKNITDTLNTAQKLKSDFDFAIQQARQNRDLQGAQFALELYKQKMNLLTQEYDLKNNKEEQLYNRGINERNYNYQVGRDKVADEQWNKSFDYQKSRDDVADRQYQEQFDYRKSRDSVSDNQWEKEYQQMLKEAELAELWRNKNFDYQQSRDAVSDAQYREQFDYQKSRDSVADQQFAQQLALSRAKASSGGSSGGGSGNLINLNDSQVNAETTGLSDTAEKIYQEYRNNKILNKIPLDKFLEQVVYDNKITPQDMGLLLAKYGG